MPKVRITLSEEPVEVREDEIPSLRAQGLLVEVTEEDAPVPAGGENDGGDAGDPYITSTEES